MCQPLEKNIPCALTPYKNKRSFLRPRSYSSNIPHLQRKSSRTESVTICYSSGYFKCRKNTANCKMSFFSTPPLAPAPQPPRGYACEMAPRIIHRRVVAHTSRGHACTTNLNPRHQLCSETVSMTLKQADYRGFLSITQRAILLVASFLNPLRKNTTIPPFDYSSRHIRFFSFLLGLFDVVTSPLKNFFVR